MNQMSVAEHIIEPDERYWDMYLQYCRAEGTTPSLKDFLVYLQEQNLDEDSYDAK